MDLFYQILSLEYGVRLFHRKSLIIFDEIQSFPKARQAVKYLVQDGRFDIIETGSLISIQENVTGITIPSEERNLLMHPLDFVEFGNYLGEEILLEHIQDCWIKKAPLPDTIHAKAMRLFKEYLIVGGMPQAVVAYKENARSFIEADIEKRDILTLYRNDIKKAARKYSSKASAIFENVPGFLSKHERKIVLKEIDPNGLFSKYDDPLFWLNDSRICNLCYKCDDPNIGFALNKNHSFVKCYMADTGLLVSLTFNENELLKDGIYKAIINDKLSINKGMLFENAISQMLFASEQQLYFYTHYSNVKHRNDIEVDFLISTGSKTSHKIIPVEVKSSKYYTTVSLNRFKELFSKRVAFSLIVHPKNFSIDGGFVKIPPYMCPFTFSDILK